MKSAQSFESVQPVDQQPRPSVRSSPDRKCRRLVKVQTRAGLRAFPPAQQQHRSLRSARHIHTRKKTPPIYAHTRSHTHSHARPARTRHARWSPSAARECPVGAVRVMAQYGAQGNALSDELEYLQAYEDVLEKYKGSLRGFFFFFF